MEVLLLNLVGLSTIVLMVKDVSKEPAVQWYAHKDNQFKDSVMEIAVLREAVLEAAAVRVHHNFQSVVMDKKLSRAVF